MPIDWFTVIAQALNFVILVWLMKRFLYKPILHAIDEREKRIAAELADAAAQKAEADRESGEFRLKNETFDQERAALLKKATDEANAERERLVEDARKAGETFRAKQQETMVKDARNLNAAIRLRTQHEVFAISRKALADLASVDLETQMVAVFVRRLREVGGQAKDDLATALQTASGPALVRSAFDLSEAPRAAIRQALNETFSAEIAVRFETESDLVGGIELVSNGQKAAWSLSDYLESLEKGIEELLPRQAAAATSPPATEPALNPVPKGP